MAKLSKKIDRLNKKLYKANKKQEKYDAKHPIQTAGKGLAVCTVCAAADLVIINTIVNHKIKKAASTSAAAANGTPAPEKKKGFFKRHFGKKDAPAAATPATPAAPAEGTTTA
jgi:hypothetical protein